MMSNRKHGNSGQTDQSLQYLPLFFCLPRALFRGHQEYMGITRHPQALLNLPAQDSVLSSSGFICFVKRICAEAIWKHLQIPKKGGHARMDSPMSDFCENFGLWQLVYSAVDYVRAILEVTEHSMQKLASLPEGSEVPWMSEKDFDELMESITDRIVREQGWQPTIDFVWKNRTPEDYSEKNSRKKIDTYRQWHHTRTEAGAKMISIEAAQEQAAANGGSFDIADEEADPALREIRSKYDAVDDYDDPFDNEDEEYHGWGQDGDYDEWLARKIRAQRRSMSDYNHILSSDFGRSLCHEDRQLLALRNEELTHKELAKLQGFSSHTGVIKRLNHIEECYKAEKPVSPRRKKVVPDAVQINRVETKIWLYFRDKEYPYQPFYLCSPKAFTLCRNCLKKYDPGKRDSCCSIYRKNGICAASDLSYIYSMRCRPRKRREHDVKDIKQLLPPPKE